MMKSEIQKLRLRLKREIKYGWPNSANQRSPCPRKGIKDLKTICCVIIREHSEAD